MIVNRAESPEQLQHHIDAAQHHFAGSLRDHFSPVRLSDDQPVSKHLLDKMKTLYPQDNHDTYWIRKHQLLRMTRDRFRHESILPNRSSLLLNILDESDVDINRLKALWHRDGSKSSRDQYFRALKRAGRESEAIKPLSDKFVDTYVKHREHLRYVPPGGVFTDKQWDDYTSKNDELKHKLNKAHKDLLSTSDMLDYNPGLGLDAEQVRADPHLLFKLYGHKESDSGLATKLHIAKSVKSLDHHIEAAKRLMPAKEHRRFLPIKLVSEPGEFGARAASSVERQHRSRYPDTYNTPGLANRMFFIGDQYRHEQTELTRHFLLGLLIESDADIRKLEREYAVSQDPGIEHKLHALKHKHDPEYLNKLGEEYNRAIADKNKSRLSFLNIGQADRNARQAVEKINDAKRKLLDASFANDKVAGHYIKPSGEHITRLYDVNHHNHGFMSTDSELKRHHLVSTIKHHYPNIKVYHGSLDDYSAHEQSPSSFWRRKPPSRDSYIVRTNPPIIWT